MAATPKRATQTEAKLHGIDLEKEATWAPAIESLALDYQPISDMRATAHYRIETAQALLRKALTEIAEGSNLRVISAEGAAA
jgi:xanthine dehydrogenase small subunit